MAKGAGRGWGRYAPSVDISHILFACAA